MNHIKIFNLSFIVFILSIININHSIGQEVDYMNLLKTGITLDSLDKIFDKRLNNSRIDLTSGKIEDDELAQYSRWRSFWKDRLTVTKDFPNGSPIPYLKALSSTTTNQVCQNNGGNTPVPNWKQLGPFEGQLMATGAREHAIGAVFAVASLPNNLNIVYIGTGSGGLWKTTNALSANPTWVNMTDVLGMPSLGISDIIIDPNNPDIVYAAASNPRLGYGLGVIKSTDGGLSWTTTGYNINSLTQNSEIIKQILFSPTNTNIIFLLTERNLHYSTNGGTSWIQTNLNIQSNNSKFNNMDFDKANSNLLYIGGQQVWSLNLPGYNLTRIDNLGTIGYPTAPSNHIYYGIDALVSGVNNGCYIFGRSWIYQDISNPAIFQTINNQPIIKYNNGTWSSININTGKRCQSFKVNSLNSNIMYIGDSPSRLVEKSINGGMSFFAITNYSSTTLYNGISTHADIRALKLISPSASGLSDILLVGDDGGVLLTQSANPTPNNLVNWKDLNGSGLAITEFFGISNNEWDANIIHGGAQDNGIFTYKDGNWKRLQHGDGYDCVNDPVNSETAYAEYNYPGQIKTVNSGNSWTSHTIPPYSATCGTASCFPPYYAISKRPHEFDINNIEYVGHKDLFKKIGNNWVPISNFIAPANCGQITDLISIAISETNTNKIYAAFSGEAWGTVPSTCLGKLFKTQNGGNLWVDISPQFSRWASISDIIVDPQNDNRIWVSFLGTNSVVDNLPKDRVNYSPDGGATWQDWSVGLPLFPVNDIIYQKGTQDVLYAATDVGVFYRKAGDLNTPWKCLKGNMPVAHIKDLEISYCSGKLRAATFGRGLWEADLVELSTFSDIVINTNTTYSNKKLINSNIIITPGATLTITSNGYLNISPGKSIIVKQGGRMIVDGGTLTNDCGKFWNGIEIWGTYSSNSLSSQGRVIIRNNATISNAAEALRMWKPGDYNSSGGIISATDSKFINNKRSAEFISYPFSYLNRGTFKNCEFITNNDYPSDGPMPFGFITLWNVNGVEFKGCDFVNNNDQYKYKFNGIYSIDASYKCTGYCDPTQPLCSMIKSKFENLKSGIESIGPNGFIAIWDSEFISNAIGVNLNNVHNSKLIRNNIKVIKTPTSSIGIGVSMENSSEFTIEDNEFSRIGIVSDPICGLIISNSGGNTPYPIQNNKFSNLTVGTYVVGTNSILNGCPFGLQYYCNQHISTAYDIYIYGTIQKIQRYNSGVFTSSGNKFSSSSFPNFTSNSSCAIDYYYSNSALLQTPTISGAIALIPVSDNNTCATNYPIGNGSIPVFSSITSKKELNKQILKISDNFKSLNELRNESKSTLLNGYNQFGSAKKYFQLNTLTNSNFLNILNFINLDSTLTLSEKSNYQTKLYLSENSNESKFDLFLSKSFNGEYKDAEKLLKSFTFINPTELTELTQLLKIYSNGRLNASLLLDKASVEEIIKIQKNTNGSFVNNFSNLILDKFSINKPSSISMARSLELLNKELKMSR